MALDLGTSSTLLYLKGQGVIANEPSFVSVHANGSRNQGIAALGRKAKELRGRTASHIITSSPLKEGLIHDFDRTVALLRHVIQKAPQRNLLSKGKLLMGAPSKAGAVEHRALIEAAELAGAHDIYLIPDGLAAAIGVGLPTFESTGVLLVDIGAGKTDIVLMARNESIFTHSTSLAGNFLDEKIMEYVRDKHGVIIGEQTAEDIKILIGAARMTKANPSIVVHGHDIAKGRPTDLKLTRKEIVEAFTGSFDELVRLVKVAIAKAPPDLTNDILNRGIILSGGGALLPELDVVISEKTGVPVVLVQDPHTAVAQGLGAILEQWQKYGHLVWSK